MGFLNLIGRGRTPEAQTAQTGNQPETGRSLDTTHIQGRIDQEIAQQQRVLQAVRGAASPNREEEERLQAEIQQLQAEKARVAGGELHLGERIGAEVRHQISRLGHIRLGDIVHIGNPLHAVHNLVDRVRQRVHVSPRPNPENPPGTAEAVAVPESTKSAEQLINQFDAVVAHTGEDLDAYRTELQTRLTTEFAAEKDDADYLAVREQLQREIAAAEAMQQEFNRLNQTFDHLVAEFFGEDADQLQLLPNQDLQQFTVRATELIRLADEFQDRLDLAYHGTNTPYVPNVPAEPGADQPGRAARLRERAAGRVNQGLEAARAKLRRTVREQDAAPEAFTGAEAILYQFDALASSLEQTLNEVRADLFPGGVDDGSNTSETRAYRLQVARLEQLRLQAGRLRDQYIQNGLVVAGKEEVLTRGAQRCYDELSSLAGEVVDHEEVAFQDRADVFPQPGANPEVAGDEPVAAEDGARGRRFGALRDRVHMPDINLPGRPDFLRRQPEVPTVAVSQNEYIDIQDNVGTNADYLLAYAMNEIRDLEAERTALQAADAALRQTPDRPYTREDQRHFEQEFRRIQNALEAARDDQRQFDRLQAEYQRLLEQFQAIDPAAENAAAEMARIVDALQAADRQIDDELGVLPPVGRLRRMGNNVVHGFTRSPQVTAGFIMHGSDLQDALAVGAVTTAARFAIGPVGWAAGAAIGAGGKYVVESRRIDRALGADRARKPGEEAHAVEDAMVRKYAQLVNRDAYREHQLDEAGIEDPSLRSEAMHQISRGLGFLFQKPEQFINGAIIMGARRKKGRVGGILEEINADVFIGVPQEDLPVIAQDRIENWLQQRIDVLHQNIENARDLEEANRGINELNRLFVDIQDLDFLTEIGVEHFGGNGKRARRVGNEEVAMFVKAIAGQREALIRLLAGYQNNGEARDASRKARKAIENLLAMLENPDQYRQDRALQLWKRMRTGDIVAIFVKAGVMAGASDGVRELLEGHPKDSHTVITTTQRQAPPEAVVDPAHMAPGAMPQQPVMEGFHPGVSMADKIAGGHMPQAEVITPDVSRVTVPPLESNATPAQVWDHSEAVSRATMSEIQPSEVVEAASRAAAVIRENPATAANLRTYLEAVDHTQLTDQQLATAITNYLQDPTISPETRQLIDQMAYGIKRYDENNQVIPVTWNQINTARQALGLAPAVPRG